MSGSSDLGTAEWNPHEPIEFVGAVRDHSAAIHAYLTRRAGRQVADDLLAEVWLRAFRSRHSFDNGWDSPRPWLYGIARNMLRAHWRLHTHPPGSPTGGATTRGRALMSDSTRNG